MHRSIHSNAFMRAAGLALAASLLFTLAGCGTGPQEVSQPPKPELVTSQIVVAFASPPEGTGLFGALAPAFETTYPQYRVKVVTATGAEVLDLGGKKGADVLVLHKPDAEATFVADGSGTNRKTVFAGDFVIVGPAADPAKVKASKLASDAFKRIAQRGSTFVSRGDDSLTHEREMALWATAGVKPVGPAWYVSTAQDMAGTLAVAGQKSAYTIVDRATWLERKASLPGLAVLLERTADLLDPYSVIEVVGAKNPEGARTFSDWLTGAGGQQAIGAFGVDKYSEPVFAPSATP